MERERNKREQGTERKKNSLALGRVECLLPSNCIEHRAMERCRPAQGDTGVRDGERERRRPQTETETLGRMQAGKRGSRDKSGKQTGQYKCGVRRQLEEQGEGALAWSSLGQLPVSLVVMRLYHFISSTTSSCAISFFHSPPCLSSLSLSFLRFPPGSDWGQPAFLVPHFLCSSHRSG